jgi:glycosyltransferase involved in cell wall biosynthesis
VVDLQKITDLNCGLGQFSWHLAHELLKIDPEIYFYLPKDFWHYLNVRHHLINQRKWHRHVRWACPQADVFHSLHQEAPYFPANAKSKYVLTVHDLNILLDADKSVSEQKRWLKAVQQRVDRAQAVIYISRYAQGMANEHLTFRGQYQAVIYNGVPVRPDLPALKPEMQMDRPFFMAIATVLKKKNFHTLIPMMERLPDYGFVLAGWKDNPYAEEMQKEIHRRNLQDRFLLIGKVSEPEKNWLYQNCQGLVFPSLQEGFGLPVVEAMHFGVPLFLSKHCALPEIGGELAFYFENFEADHMAEVVSRGITEASELPDLPAALRRRGESFSWSRAAEQYYQLYQSLQ